MGICQWGLEARAGDWTIKPGVSVSEQFTDNRDLVPDNSARRSDFITNVNPSISVRGAGARASLDLDYSFRQLYFADRGDNDQIHDLASRGQLEFWRNIGFIDATASMSRQVVNNQGPISDSLAGQTVNRADQRAFSVSPFFLYHLGPWVDSEFRLRYAMVDVKSTTIPDTNEYAADINLTSGRRFPRLHWTFHGHADQLDRSAVAGTTNKPNATTVQADYDVNYPIIREVSLLGGVGYENIHDPTLGSQPSGVTWRAGLRLDPSAQTTLTATYGRRYGDSNIFVDATHQLSSRTSLHASYNETLQTNQQLAIQDLSFLGVDANGNLIDTRTGLPFSVGNNAFGLQSGTFRQRAATIGITAKRRRDSIDFNASWETRRANTPAIREDIVRGMHLTASHQLSRRTTGAITADYRNIDFGGSTREDNLFTFSANLTYEIFRGTSAVIAFIRTQRRSNVASGDLTENAASIRVSKGF